MVLERRCELRGRICAKSWLASHFWGKWFLHLSSFTHSYTRVSLGANLHSQLCPERLGQWDVGCLLLEGEAQQNKRTEDEYVRLYSAYKNLKKIDTWNPT